MLLSVLQLIFLIRVNELFLSHDSSARDQLELTENSLMSWQYPLRYSGRLPACPTTPSCVLVSRLTSTWRGTTLWVQINVCMRSRGTASERVSNTSNDGIFSGISVCHTSSKSCKHFHRQLRCRSRSFGGSGDDDGGGGSRKNSGGSSRSGGGGSSSSSSFDV